MVEARQLHERSCAVTPANLALRQTGPRDSRSGGVSMRSAAPQASAALAGLATEWCVSRPPRRGAAPLARGPLALPRARLGGFTPEFGAELLQDKGAMVNDMNAVKATVVNGRYVIEEPANLPDGTELYLVPVSEEDEDRIDVEEANKVLAEMKATKEQPLSIDEVAARYGL